MNFSTPDLCDAHPGQVEVVSGLNWRGYGGKAAFYGPIETVKCFEDNSRVKECLSEKGGGRVLV
ncbi:MAG: putative 4-hydroxy-4-methyl-2-oxoglutarate aldolase, partial [Wenzhouxiangella sp.]